LDLFTMLYRDCNKTPHETFRAKKQQRINSQKSYNLFRERFMHVAAKEGFCVSFFAGNTVPVVKLHYNCTAVKAGPGLSAEFRSR